jgi:hypothetical protein
VAARPWHLFDLQEDAYEQNYMLDKPKNEPVTTTMHRQLITLLDKSGDDFAIVSAFGHPARCAVSL